MTDLSPQAQSMVILDAFLNGYVPARGSGTAFAADRSGLAAALREVANLESIKPEAVGPCDERYGSSEKQITISEQDLNYRIALAVKLSKVAAHRLLLAIASELG